MERHGIHGPSTVFFEDMARNLEPAKARGMTTVWIEGHSDYARAGVDGGYIDHHASELTPWLTDLLPHLETA